MGQLVLPRSVRPSLEIEPVSLPSTTMISTLQSFDLSDHGQNQFNTKTLSPLQIHSLSPIKSKQESSPLTAVKTKKKIPITESIG